MFVSVFSTQSRLCRRQCVFARQCKLLASSKIWKRMCRFLKPHSSMWRVSTMQTQCCGCCHCAHYKAGNLSRSCAISKLSTCRSNIWLCTTMNEQNHITAYQIMLCNSCQVGNLKEKRRLNSQPATLVLTPASNFRSTASWSANMHFHPMIERSSTQRTLETEWMT